LRKREHIDKWKTIYERILEHDTTYFCSLGGWLGGFLGGCDGLLYALLVFVIVDFVTGVLCAINDKALSSEVGF